MKTGEMVVRVSQDWEKVGSHQHRHIIRFAFDTAQSEPWQEDMLRVATGYSRHRCGPIEPKTTGRFTLDFAGPTIVDAKGR